MAVKEIAVCDVCGSAAAQSITLSIGVSSGKRRNFTKDLCQKHLDSYLVQARPAHPGRPSKIYSGETPTFTPRRFRSRSHVKQVSDKTEEVIGKVLELKEMPSGEFVVAS